MTANALLIWALSLAPGQAAPVAQVAQAAQAAQAAPLEIKESRSTYGFLGPRRPDFKITPGDFLFVTFDLIGLKANPDGRIEFDSDMEVLDSKKASVYKKTLVKVEYANLMGGKTPHTVSLPVSVASPPGDYALVVKVTDRVSKATATLNQPFTITKPDFALVSLQFSYDDGVRIPAPAVGAVGQVLFVNVSAVGYKRNENGLGEVEIEMSLLDAAGKPTAKEPLVAKIRSIPSGTDSVPIGFNLPVSQAGQFTVVLKATDKVAKASKSLSVPFLAVESK